MKNQITAINEHAYNILRNLVMDSSKTITSHIYLLSNLACRSTDELKNTEKVPVPGARNLQYPPIIQQELSMRGQRTRFLQFHRFMFSLSNDEIKLLKAAYKNYKVAHNDDKYVFIDQMLINDAIDYHLCIRNAELFDVATSEEIVKSFNYYSSLAENHDDITSEHLIELLCDIADYQTKH